MGSIILTGGPVVPANAAICGGSRIRTGRHVIPANARAVSYNLTATGITGPNYLSVTPGSAAAFTVSSINFTATDIANGGIVRLSTGGNVKVFCGDNTGSTDFIIDITGYYI